MTMQILRMKRMWGYVGGEGVGWGGVGLRDNKQALERWLLRTSRDLSIANLVDGEVLTNLSFLGCGIICQSKHICSVKFAT